MKAINILYIIDYWGSPGGTERHLSYLLHALHGTTYRCGVVIFNYEPNMLVDRARQAGVEIIHVPVARYYTPNALAKGATLWRYIKNGHFDIVQTFHYKADIYGATLARLAGVKAIISSKRDAADYKSAFRFFMHKLVRPITKQYIAVSGVVAKVIRDKEGVPAVKIATIYNGVDLNKYTVPSIEQKAHARANIGLATNDFVVGMSAWFRPEKDHEMLINAFLGLHAMVPCAKLLLVGGGSLLDHYRAQIAQRGLTEEIKLIGSVDDVTPYLQAMDVACLVPKINEGFSNSILEKMATGLPIIVTDIGGNKEAVQHGVNGFVIEPSACADLTRYLQQLCEDDALRNRMGQASRLRVEQLFSLEQMVNKHKKLYSSVLE